MVSSLKASNIEFSKSREGQNNSSASEGELEIHVSRSFKYGARTKRLTLGSG